MKKILCYGDSNTFGFVPEDGSRFDADARWTGVLQKILGRDYLIIEEDACDRTGFVHNPKGDLYSAQNHFPVLMSKNMDIDILILAIGSNDMQFQYNIDFSTVEKGLENLIKTAKIKTDNIILIPPVILDNNVLNGGFSFQFDKTSIKKSQKVGDIYKKIAQIFDCLVFDINEFVRPSNIDGLHYDRKSHSLVAKNLAEIIHTGFVD